MSLGVPVIAFRVNAVAPIVLRSQSGAVYSTAGELAAALASVKTNRADMSEAARDEFSRRWTKELWLKRITDLYKQVTCE